MAGIRHCDKCGAVCTAKTCWELSRIELRVYAVNIFGDCRVTKANDKLEESIEVCPDCKNDIIRVIKPELSVNKFAGRLPRDN